MNQPSIAQSKVIARLPAEVRHAVEACRVMLEELPDEDRRLAVLMVDVKLGKLSERRLQ